MLFTSFNYLVNTQNLMYKKHENFYKEKASEHSIKKISNNKNNINKTKHNENNKIQQKKFF